MIATQVLIEHHEVLRSLMDRAGSAVGIERHRLLSELADELTIHEQIEDEIFYPAVVDLTTRLAPSHAEHRQMENQLAIVLRAERSPAFTDELRVLRAALEQHGGTEEEQGMFPEVERQLSARRLDELGEQLSARQARLRASRIARLRLRFKRELLRRLPSLR